MSGSLAIGDRVYWSTSGGRTHGTIEGRRTPDFQFDGQKFHASDDEPTFIVKSEKPARPPRAAQWFAPPARRARPALNRDRAVFTAWHSVSIAPAAVLDDRGGLFLRQELLPTDLRLWLQHFALANFDRILASFPIPTWFGNSVAIAVVVTGLLLSMLPMVVVFVAFQRYFVQGFARSGIR